MNMIACKRSVKEVEAAIELAGFSFEKSIAKTGTVYFSIHLPEDETIDVRIADHGCVANAYSHDGRTAFYTIPDIEIDRAGNGIDELCDKLGVEYPKNIQSRIERAQNRAVEKIKNEITASADQAEKAKEFAKCKAARMAENAAKLGLTQQYKESLMLTGKARKKARYVINAKIKKAGLS